MAGVRVGWASGMSDPVPPTRTPRLRFAPMSVELVIIGGGNMGAALLGGMIAAGADPATLAVVEPLASRREQLERAVP